MLCRIENDIDDLLLPYSFDISIYADIDNAELIDHVNRVGKSFYQNPQLKPDDRTHPNSKV